MANSLKKEWGGERRIVVAKVLSLTWGLWWLFFGLLSAFSENLSLSGTLIHLTVPGLIFLASVAIAWFWRKVGGVILLSEGLLVAMVYSKLVRNRVSPSQIPVALFTLALLAVPPIIAGYLFFADPGEPGGNQEIH